MQVITTVLEMQQATNEAQRQGKSVGCVPTMGSLHAGHASLIEASSKRHDLTVVSVFVNPTQFGPTEDYDSYPRDLDGDIAAIGSAGGTHIFAPTVVEMYPDGFSTTVHVGDVTKVLEGARRPGHFDGVSTIVCKLFEAMRPDEAFFGQKDLQQTLVIKRMVRDLLMPIKIAVMPTLREDSGLAMSSRNVYLSDQERHNAAVLYRALQAAVDLVGNANDVVSRPALEHIMANMLSTVEGLEIDYAVALDADTLQPADSYGKGDEVALLIAVFLGSTRPIDNMLVRV